MEINSQQTAPPQSTPLGSAQNQKTTNEQLQTKDQESNIQTADITVNLSSEAVRLSSASEQKTQSQVNSEEQALQATEQFKQDIESNPSAVQFAQSGNISSEQVNNLIS